MKVAFIRPTSVLETHGNISDYHMVLAPDILKDTKYRLFYKHRVDIGDTVILDNGIAEEVSLSTDDLDRAIASLNPTYVVLQDIIFGGKRSLEKTFRHLAYVKEVFPNQKVMAVPHFDHKALKAEEKVRIFLECLKSLLDSEDVDAIGISKYATEPFGSRAAILRVINDNSKFHSHKPIHLLGLSHQDGALEPLTYRGFCLEIMGIDSAHYIIYASMNLDSPKWVGITKRPEDFMSWKVEEEAALVDIKLRRFMEIVNDVN